MGSRWGLGFALLLAGNLGACGGDEFSSGSGGAAGGANGGTGATVAGGGTGATPTGGSTGSGGATDGGVGGVAGAAGSGGGCNRCSSSELCCEDRCLGIEGTWIKTSETCDGNPIFDATIDEKWMFEAGGLGVISSDADCKAEYTATFLFLPPNQFHAEYTALACTPDNCALGANEPGTCAGGTVNFSLDGTFDLDCASGKLSVPNSDVCGGTGKLAIGFER